MRKQFLIVVALALVQVATGTASAQVIPSRPITLVVPYPAGGPSDTLARILGKSMRGLLGQPIIIENVSGAGGAIGVGPRRARGARRLHAQPRPCAGAHVIDAATQTLQYDGGEGFRAGVAPRGRHAKWIAARSTFPGEGT